MAEENNFLQKDSINGETKDSTVPSKLEESTNQEKATNQVPKREDNKTTEAHEDSTPRAYASFSVSLLHRRLEDAAKGYEEILRIIHSTNLKNAILVKKNFYEIELICKNALLELKGV